MHQKTTQQRTGHSPVYRVAVSIFLYLLGRLRFRLCILYFSCISRHLTAQRVRMFQRGPTMSRRLAHSTPHRTGEGMSYEETRARTKMKKEKTREDMMGRMRVLLLLSSNQRIHSGRCGGVPFLPPSPPLLLPQSRLRIHRTNHLLLPEGSPSF